MNSDRWQQGCFIDGPEYWRWTEEEKEKAREAESHFVRSGSKGNAICYCNKPSDAKYIASRLNFAEDLEELCYDFFTGKDDGKAIIEYVRRGLDKI
jgi:hypothetical protein